MKYVWMFILFFTFQFLTGQPFTEISTSGWGLGMQNCTPELYDLDDDGLVDMLVGDRNGTIKHFEQTYPGSKSFYLVNKSFEDINLGGFASPDLIDLDQNGMMDLIIGGIGGLFHYEQDGINSTGFEFITNSFSSIPGNKFTTPCLFYMDDDYRVDMFVNYDEWGDIRYYEQTTYDPFVFSLVSNLYGASGGFLDVPNKAIIDLDYDGYWDLFIGNEFGSVVRFEQTGYNNWLYEAAGLIPGVQMDGASAPAFFDLDQNGRMDMIVGDYDGNISIYEQDSITGTGVLELIGQTWPVTYPNPSIADTDHDGLLDLFLGGYSGCGHYEQLSPGSVHFGYLTDNPGIPGSLIAPRIYDLDNDGLYDLLAGTLSGPIFHYEQVSYNSDNFYYVSSSFFGMNFYEGSPTCADLDDDGLYDILVGNISGTLYHFEQITPDSYDFELVTNVFDSIDVGGSSSPNLTDLDGDGLLDLFIGHTGGTIHHYIQNENDPYDFILQTDDYLGIVPDIYSVPCFTSLTKENQPTIFIHGFGDGLYLFSEQNDGNDNFEYVSNFRFEMDAGSNSKPFAYHIDDDGLLDILVGNEKGHLEYYRQFEYNSDSFLMVTNMFNEIGVEGYSSPAITDFNSNGLLDLLIGNAAGTIDYYEQVSYNSLIFEMVQQPFSNIDVGSYATPCLYDIDNDGLMDMLVGASNGYIARYEQVESGNTEFQLINQFFNGIGVGGHSKPMITDFYNDQLYDLLIGNQSGNLVYYKQLFMGSEIFVTVTEDYYNLSVAGFSSPTIGDYNNDQLPEIFLGRQDGGMSLFENILSEEPVDIIYEPQSVEVCEYDSAFFVVAAIGYPVQYQWQKNNVNIPEANENILIFPETSIEDSGYYRCLCYNNLNTDTSETLQLNVLPNPMVNISAFPDDTVCISSTILLDAGDQGESYFWSTGETSQQIEVSNTSGPGGGDQSYWVEVINGNDCLQLDSISVFFDPCTGIDTNKPLEVNVYPIPAKNMIYIKKTNPIESDFIIYDIFGNQLTKGVSIGSVTRINISSFSQGIYFLHLKWQNRQKVVRFIKK